MRLSKFHLKVIEEMKDKGYVWLSNMHVNAQMRFRNKTRKGFDKYIKEAGLTFLTKEVAKAFELGTKKENKPRLTLVEQVDYLINKLADREAYIKQLEGKLGAEHK